MTRSNLQGLLDNIEIAAPCKVSWESMTGTDKIRFCQQCKLNVYNISEMSAGEADQLFLESGIAKRLCLRLYRRSDGTVLTKNCPVGMKEFRDRCNRLWQMIGMALLWLFSCIRPTQADDAAPVPQKVERQQQIDFLVSPKVQPSPKGTQRETGYTMGAVAVDFGPFMADVQKRILASWQKPAGFDNTHRVVVAFQIMKDGSVSDTRVVKSCGFPQFDAIALDAIRKAAPFRSPPESPQEGISVEFRFDQNLKNSLPDKGQKEAGTDNSSTTLPKPLLEYSQH